MGLAVIVVKMKHAEMHFFYCIIISLLSSMAGLIGLSILLDVVETAAAASINELLLYLIGLV